MSLDPLPIKFKSDKRKRLRYHSEGDAASVVISTSSCELTNLLVTNNTAVAGFVQIHDATSLPSPGALPLVVFPIPANTAVSLDTPVPCLNGLVVAISTTQPTLTISSNEALFFANLTD